MSDGNCSEGERDHSPVSGHGIAAASLGRIVGPSFARAAVPGVIRMILDVFVGHRIDHETFLTCFRRIGIEPFKEKIYATAE